MNFAVLEDHVGGPNGGPPLNPSVPYKSRDVGGVSGPPQLGPMMLKGLSLSDSVQIPGGMHKLNNRNNTRTDTRITLLCMCVYIYIYVCIYFLD